MINSFNVDINKKKQLAKNKRKSSGEYKKIKTLKTFFAIAVIAAPIVFLFYAYKISSGFIYLNDRYAPMGTKNSLFIWTIAGTMMILLFFFYLILKILHNKLLNGEMNERFAENIVFDSGILTYGYKVGMYAYKNDRVIVTIDLKDVLCQVNTAIKKITFKGNVYSQYYTNYQTKEKYGRGGYLDEDFIIYDYFEPSLIEFLQSINANIKYE